MPADPEDAYEINRILLSIIGLWPKEKTPGIILHRAVFFTMLLSLFFVQVMCLFKSDIDLTSWLYSLTSLIPTLASILKYVSFTVQTDKVKTLTRMIKDDWNLLRNEECFKIIRNYMKITKLLVTVMLGAASCSVGSLVVVQFLPGFLDIVAPLNVSRPVKLPVPTQYFIDEQKYYYPLVVHLLLSCFIALFVLVSTEAICMTYIMHICSMFKVTGYYLDNCLTDAPHSLKADHENYKRIRSAVNIHNRSIKFAEFMWSTFSLSYSLLIVIGLVSLSVSLFRVFRALKMSTTIKEMSASVILSMAQYTHLFLANYFAQLMTDHSGDVYYKICDTRWYEASLRVQKLLLFILQRCQKKTAFVSGGVFTASLEGFSTLTSMSFSYFTVIYSTN